MHKDVARRSRAYLSLADSLGSWACAKVQPLRSTGEFETALCRHHGRLGVDDAQDVAWIYREQWTMDLTDANSRRSPRDLAGIIVVIRETEVPR
jgi:hypothetical protein